MAQTYVLVPSSPHEEPCEVLGYYTLVPYQYRDAEMDETTARALKVSKLGSIPMILLGQLGMGVAHQGKGLGAALLRDALRRSLFVALSIGAVVVITDPVNERAASFYLKHGFRSLPLQEPRLLIPTKQLARYNPDILTAFKQRPELHEVAFGAQHFLA